VLVFGTDLCRLVLDRLPERVFPVLVEVALVVSGSRLLLAD
jgi:hypothetical protein